MASCRLRVLSAAAITLLSLACGSGNPASPTPAGPSAALTGDLSLNGDPESAEGATWTFAGMRGSVAVDLQGVLLKPAGPGPFPAVVISHGNHGSASGYSRAIARDMVTWGLVCIATNYTHAGGGVPLGSPGSPDDRGASAANVVRARAARDILERLGYVDMSRVAAHGHSMGAFVTAALLGAHPQAFRAASHTAGGVRLPVGGLAEMTAPAASQVAGIRTPYQLHHGAADIVVPLVMDQQLAALLDGNGVLSELHVYPGASHGDVSRDAIVLGRIRAWYAAHGMF